MTDLAEAASLDLETLLDHEARDAKTELRLWLRLLSMVNLINQELRTRLRESHDMTIAKFDLLAQLDRASEGMRLGELSKRLMVTNGNVTGLVDRLVDDGFITRKADDKDKRVALVRLTTLGAKTFSAIAAEHELWVKELFSGVDAETLRALTGEIGALKASVTARRKGEEAATDAPEPRQKARNAISV